MPSIEPDLERVRELVALDDGAPVVMINLLRFRERAAYPAGFDAAPCTGREAYERYGAALMPLLQARGARILWRGSARAVVIGPEDEAWHEAILVEYPAIRALIGMVTSAEYQAVAAHRTAALADSRLIATRTAQAEL